MVLTNYILKKEIKRLIRKASERPHQYRSLNDIKHVLFICDSKDWNTVRSCIEKLKAMNKHVNTAIFATSKKDVPTWYSNYLLLRADRDVGWLGFPDKTLQKQFYCLPADLLIDFSSSQVSPLYYMFLKHPSTFKAGIKYSEDSAYDLAIVPTNEADEADEAGEGREARESGKANETNDAGIKQTLPYLFNQLVSYLSTVNSKPEETVETDNYPTQH